MLPDRVSNPGPLTNESGALPIALRGPAAKGHNSVKNVDGDMVLILSTMIDDVLYLYQVLSKHLIEF